MLDNELQGLRKMLLQAMLQDSLEAKNQAQQRIELELEKREKEKASRDSLIAEKIAALDAAAAKVSLEAEGSSNISSTTIILIALAILSSLLLIALVFILGKNKQQNGPMQPYMYPPPPRRRKRKKPLRPKSQNNKTEEIIQKEPPAQLDPIPSVDPEPLKEDNKQKIIENQEDDSESIDVGEDPNVLKSEIDDIRKSIVSMSVGQPGRTSTIVKEWLEQPAPEPAASEEPSEASDSAPVEEPSEKK
jgi:hypothetical protein